MKKIFFLFALFLVSNVFAYTGDGLGNHKAKKDLNMNTHNINSVGTVDGVDVSQIQIDSTSLNTLKADREEVRLSTTSLNILKADREEVRLSTTSLQNNKMDKSGGIFTGPIVVGTITATTIYAEDVHVSSITYNIGTSTAIEADYISSKIYDNVKMLDNLNLNNFLLYGGVIVDAGIQASTTALESNKFDKAGGNISGALTVTGTTTLKSSGTVEGALGVTGDLTVGGTADIYTQNNRYHWLNGATQTAYLGFVSGRNQTYLSSPNFTTLRVADVDKFSVSATSAGISVPLTVSGNLTVTETITSKHVVVTSSATIPLVVVGTMSATRLNVGIPGSSANAEIYENNDIGNLSINARTDMSINIDCDNTASNQHFYVANNRTGQSGGNTLLDINELGNVIALGAYVPGTKTIAQLKVYTPIEVGEIWRCSDSTPPSIYISTGTTQYGFVKQAVTTVD